MKNNTNGVGSYFKEMGFWLPLFRAPRILWKRISTEISTRYWRCFLGALGKNSRIAWGVKVHRPHKVFIGDHVYISELVWFGSESVDGKLIIEDNVQINRGCFIDHSGDTRISQGTLISEGANIFSHTHEYNPRQPSYGIPKTIGPDCWIGFHATIGERATVISPNVIIATGSLVVKSCDIPFGIYGGNPAKLIKTIEPAIDHNSKVQKA